MLRLIIDQFSLTCVISKVFEVLLLSIYRDELETNELQFGFKLQYGFKLGISCPDVVFSVKTVVD